MGNRDGYEPPRTQMAPTSNSPTLVLKVRGKSEIAEGIFLFDLVAADASQLPAFTPGAHITVTAPSGQSRRYSLCNSSAERDRYLIAVKQEIGGRGGSLSFTRDVNVGDNVNAEPPSNEFEMSRTTPRRIIFIAGGIGITPIRSMILDCLARGFMDFRLYFFARTAGAMAFRDEFSAPQFAGRAILHNDNGDPDQAFDLWPVLEEQDGAHLYCCGPRGLMDAVRDMTGHWSDSSVHFEDFVGASLKRPDDVPFEIRLGKSGQSFVVPAGTSILDTLRRNGHALPSSCESGTCGTCRTRFTDGEPDHRDFVLTQDEKATDIMVCVSRAKSAYLTLDI